MHCYTKIDDDLFYIGFSDRRINLFENVYPVPEGISYNSYLLLDDKTVLFDTVDHSVSSVFIDNLNYLLGERGLDYVVVNHIEPDHSATLKYVIEKYNEAKIVCTKQAQTMMGQFFNIKSDDRFILIENTPELIVGKHTLSFTNMPMVHWPEVMVTFDKFTGTLFSADAFGAFGAIAGNIFADSVVFDEIQKEMYRRYYTGIVGKYGMFVQNALNSLSSLPIKRICPLHGRIWRKNLNKILELYDKWSKFENEQKGVTIAYASVYGGTELASNILANALAERGITNIDMFDVSVTDKSYLLSSIMKNSHLVLASTTYNMGLFVKMEELIDDLIAHNFQNKVVGIIENGSWAPTAKSLIIKKLETLKNMNILKTSITIKSKPKQSQLIEIIALADEIVKTM